jgi:hypothetical protein
MVDGLTGTLTFQAKLLIVKVARVNAVSRMTEEADFVRNFANGSERPRPISILEF